MNRLLSFLFSAVCLLLLGLPLVTFAQQDLLANLGQAKNDIEKIAILNQLATYETNTKNYEKAVLYGKQSLDLANKTTDNNLKGQCLRVIGKAYQGQNDFSSALNHYLQSVILFESINDNKQLADDHADIATLYMQRSAYQKSIENLQKALTYYQKANSGEGEENTLNALGDSYLALKDYTNATKYYAKAIELYRKKNNTTGISKTLSKLAALNKITNNYEEALKYSEEKFVLHKSKGEKLESAFAANNVGFLYRQKGDNTKSVEYFNQALELFKQASAESKQKSPVIYNNIGVTYTNLGDYRKAANYYNEVLKMNEENKNYPEVANSYNYLAANDYISANNDQALYNVQKAIEIGEANKATAQLVESYQILSEIYAKDNDFKRSQEAFKKHQELKDQLTQEQRKQEEESKQTQMEAEKKEGEFKLLIADKEKQELAVNQLKLEGEKKQKELELQEKQVTVLKQEKEIQKNALDLQKLEREKVQKDKELAEKQLALAQRQLDDEKQKQQIANLEKEKQIEALAKKEEIKARELVEAQSKLQQQQMEEEAAINSIVRKATIGIILLFLAIIMVIAYAFYQKQRAAKVLSKQKALIEQKNADLEKSELEIKNNLSQLQGAYAIIKKSEDQIRQKNEELQASEEELRQNMEELQATYEVIETQKDQLESQNNRMTQSIRYAERIQSAILPTIATRKAIFPESFLVYKPKDIVSGDFFWISEESNIKIAAVIDCTGHGVPGAFMSMIGYTILNDTINNNQEKQPAKILQNLNKEIKKRLKQNEGANNDGMDLGICVLEKIDNITKLTYAGAKHKLYIWTNNELQELKSDRKMIGGVTVDENQEFSEVSMELSKGDILYLTTDGYIDQANEARTSFGPVRFKNLIQTIAKLSMVEQGKAFENALHEHQKDTEQRDDITVLAVQIT
jgi:serine phosphatase RsbU (regulator of sigma subunit)/tetratricopeptide (TPR) repeat protein